MPVPVVAKPGEYTRVGLDTEVKIPWLTYVFMGIVLSICNVGAWAIGFLLWFRARSSVSTFWRWLRYDWGEWFATEWVWFVITLILCWIGPSAWAYLYRLLVEQLAKNTPTYDNLDPREGIWRPWRSLPYEDEPEEEMEKDAETVDLNLWDILQGRGSRKRMRKAPSLLVSVQARSYYRALAAGIAPFSERGAKKYGVRPGQFRKNIRDALLFKGLAHWKDEENRKQGLVLSDAALVTLEHLGKHPTPPRKRA